MSPSKSEAIDKRFTYHPPKPDQRDRDEMLRAMGRSFAQTLAEKCPESRELSIAMTKLEETIMWANAAIARNE